MYKISEGRVVYSFLFFMLFIGIITNRVSIYLSYIIIFVFVFIVFFLKFKKKQLPTLELVYSIWLLFILYIAYIYKYIEYGYSNLYYTQFFGSQIIFFLLLGFFINLQFFVNKYLANFLLYGIIFIFLSILIDYLILVFGLPLDLQLMYRDGLYTYYEKPFGLFGQPSLNSTYIVVFFMFYLFLKNDIISTKNKFYIFLIVTVSVVLQNSGSGYIAYAFLCFTYFYKNKLFKYLVLPLFIFIFIFIILNNLIHKISIDYILYLYNYFRIIIENYLYNDVHNILDVLFGIDGNKEFSIDFGPLFLIAKVGLIYFIFYTIALVYLIMKSNNIYFRVGIFTLILTNIHYPTLFYPIMNILLSILFIYIINSNKQKTFEVI